MKYLDEFRDGRLAQGLAARIQREIEPDRRYALMEFCGGHTHAICRHGIEDLLPAEVRLIHGPGCPVCVLPSGRLQAAIDLVERERVILCSYGDLLRVPGAQGDTLLKAKARGADVRMVYSVSDALEIARAHPDRPVVFFAIGFETTTPPTAVVLRQARREKLGNFSVYCNHVLTPPALRALLATDLPPPFQAAATRGTGLVDGFIGPAHVSTIIGTRAYEFVATEYRRPLVIAGFEPLDVLQSILMLVRQINAGEARVENEYTRAVGPEGNRKAQQWMDEVFEVHPSFEWRGLGELPNSALAIRPAFADWDAERRFAVPTIKASDHKACACGEVLRGIKRPEECKVFASACTPDHPLGSCMVSAEGACAAHYHYGRFRQAVTA
ncbi:MAG: hydrogenase formation protein HypD [Candidatus Competibacter phosphatis]|uniref:Hydrogenase maturation factor n=1 Tax=Candidatus Competibacter phosphatis TaxID=221280 RepID=A0ABX1TH22_9GAMM|nr:hydrogenase formation protein HypD [Candidatus Competibacter phosphatis]NMQ17949.1 hydrogenase formation protein HypD [Candidatus Competibacter phosphatis]